MIECVACAGARDADCPHCEGTGQQSIKRCPWVCTGVKERFVCEMSILVEAGLLPFDGLAWSDLPAGLVSAWRIVASERIEIDRRRMNKPQQ